MTDTSGYQVLGEELTTDAKNVRTAADKVTKAQGALRDDGHLPPLDPLGRALGSCLVAFLAFPFLGLDIPFTGPIQDLAEKATSGWESALGLDPYPPVRDAWIDALGTYVKLVRTAAKKIDDTAARYQQHEQDTAGSFQRLRGGGDYAAPKGGSGDGSGSVSPSGQSGSDSGIYAGTGS